MASSTSSIQFRCLPPLHIHLTCLHQSQIFPSFLRWQATILVCTRFHPKQSSQGLLQARRPFNRRCHPWQWYLSQSNCPFHLSLPSHSQTLSNQQTILADLRLQKPYFPGHPPRGSGVIIFPRSFKTIRAQALPVLTWERFLYRSLHPPQFLKLRSLVLLLRAKRRVYP